ncbi:receptor-like protein 6 [Apium graveolens]|uniref:receptor-like protein 6 n=1 Tax=Apium graveolens TaxID=4045 RepID=UPI003D796832
MSKFRRFFTFMVMLISVQYHSVASSAAIHLSPAMQKHALFQFKQSLQITSPTICSYHSLFDDYSGISSHEKTMNWNMSSDHCTWEGVYCKQKTRDVIGLDLSCGQLVGAIRPNSTLFQLSYLRFLNLSWNNFSLSDQFPQEFGSFAKGLTHLNLSNTKFSGIVPSGISLLYKLVSLDLSELPVKLENKVFQLVLQNLTQLRVLKLRRVDISSILPTNLSNSLRVLDLGGTHLYGALPQEILFLPQLEEVNLSDNSINLTSSLPNIKRGSSDSLLSLSTSLKYLKLGGSNSGVLPQQVFHLFNLEVLDIHEGNANLTVMLPKVKWGCSASLRKLDLRNINLKGGVPDSIALLESLATLVLSNCNLSGPIPRSIGNLSRLAHLDLSYNYLNSKIPEVLANHTNLRVLDLLSNNLTGRLPSWLFELTSLEVLDIGHNRFTGQLGEFFSSNSQLQQFSCRNNSLYGPIRQSFSELVNLNKLDFSLNNFSGILDIKMFSRLEYLDTLSLSDNSLSLISTSMATLPHKLKYLYLSSCKMKEFPRVSGNAEIIKHIDLSNNQIEGVIPQWIGSVGSDYINLAHNSITGGLELLPWDNIKILDLQDNLLNGSLPRLICNASYLEILILSHNNLGGVLPTCSTVLSRLSVFDLRMNNIQGSLPSSLANFQYLLSMNLYGNKLEGKIPSSFAKFYYLEVFDIGSNQINDTFPQCLEALPNLQVLVLKSNKFHGLINRNSKVEHPFPSLRIFDLSYNEFSGPLPEIYFRNFKAMMDGEVTQTNGNFIYSDSTTLVIEGEKVDVFRMLPMFTTVDVSRNNFGGKIPEIIGNLSVLESLDLSSNQLEGEIPQQLTSILPLALLNMSYNQLRGHIPKGLQFNTFSNDSYVGNLGLCGVPLSKECEIDAGTQEDEEDDDYFYSGFTWEAVVIGYGCGAVPAFIAGYLMFLAGKPKWFAGIISRELELKIRKMGIKWR